MRVLQLEKVGVFFPGRTLFSGISWSVFRGQRVGLVGVNGAGKSTLLKIIAGDASASEGQVSLARDATAGYLPQSGVAFRGSELFAEAFSGLPDIPHLLRQLEEARTLLPVAPHDEALLELVGVLEHRFHMLEGYRAEAKVAAVLGGLGFKESDFRRSTEEFSGGWQMRIALSKLLLHDPDILLLDEPTNHLDLQTVLWLEGFLREFNGAVILVSHDREFLDGMITEIAELAFGRLTLYPGNYSDYEAGREEREQLLIKEQEKVDTERKHLEKFVERFRYKASKATQAQSRLKRLEKLEDVEQLAHTKSIHFRFPEAEASGKWVLELSRAGKSYGSLSVFEGLDFVVQRGERIALVGANGAGKSTLCRLISRQETPTQGTVDLGHNVKVEFFAQEAESGLNLEATVLEEAEAENRSMSQSELRGLLGAFLFQGDDVHKRVKVLSGGEKSRLALAKLLLRPANFLILDEPTNHLDMASQDVLLDALKHYGGTLLIVSHDRFFLDRLVGRVLELEAGRLRDWPGTLSDFLERKGLSERSRSESGAPQAKQVDLSVGKLDGAKREKELKRLEAEIRNRYSAELTALKTEAERCEQRIARLEARQQEIEVLLADSEFYGNPAKSGATVQEYKRIREDVPRLYDQWQEAERRLAKLEMSKNIELEKVRATENA
ncbi:MAG: ATP-binding cassette domain-containing protein [Calditrichaeota bacterium]|nr:ATP-binding cassette domain-containing protein [Calditrichota bacterium]MCB9366423.1 ATP-binding cassette domain-containing protein [Calditrichota bacterium]